MTKTLIRAPWHYWVICVIWTAWNVLAATDYVFSVTQREAYYQASGMTQAQVAYFTAQPLWVSFMWTLSVWAGVVSAICLLLRQAYTGFMIRAAIVGTVGYCVYVYALSEGITATGTMWFMPALMVVIMILLERYVQGLTAAKVMAG